MEKYFLILSFFIFSFVYAQVDYFEEGNILSNSIDDIINDFKGILDDETIDSLLFLNRKGILSYTKLYEVTDNIFISKMIFDRIKLEEKNILFASGIHKKEILSNDMKFFSYGYLNTKAGRFYFLTSKDYKEKYFDHNKFGYSYSNKLKLGNFRIKIGKGLFSDYSNYFYFYEMSFYADRCEDDLSLSEYASYRGLLYNFSLKNIFYSFFVSYNDYDAIIENDTIVKILQYNPHETELQISRKNNLQEMLAGMILRTKDEKINLGLYFSQYSNFIYDLNKDKNALFSLYGKHRDISYDFAYSLNGGYSMIFEMRRKLHKFRFNAGYALKKDFYNPHSRFIHFNNNFQALYLKTAFRDVVNIEYMMQYLIKENAEIQHKIKYKPFSYLEIEYTAKAHKLDYNLKIVLRNIKIHEFNTKYQFIATEKGSMLVRMDGYLNKWNMRMNLFGYAYNVNNDDVIYQYENKIDNVYPLKGLYEGSSIRCGVHISSPDIKRMIFSGSIIYDLNNSIEIGLLIKL